MSDPTLAEQLIDLLRQAGVEQVYGVVGDSLNPVVDVVDAIRRTDGIDWVHVAERGGGRVRRRGRGPADRPAGGVRGQLPPRQYASGAGLVRRPPLQRADARDRLEGPPDFGTNQRWGRERKWQPRELRWCPPDRQSIGGMSRCV
jgi:hypothetical protein